MAVRFLLFFHLLGMVLWLGGMLVGSIWTSRARKTGDLKLVAFAYTTAHRLYRGIVGGGVALSVASGVALMFAGGRPWFRPFPEHWLFQMQIVGLLVALVTVFYVMPNAAALARLAGQAAAEGEQMSGFGAKVRRQAIVGSLLGLLLVYLVLLGALRF
jgi:uncharacterized membrane protein